MSNHIKQISRTVKSLKNSQKIIFMGSLILIAGLFFPWFTINSSDLFSNGDSISTIAFTGQTYIIGYLCYFFTIATLHTIDKKLTISVAIVTFLIFLLNVIFNQNESGISLFATLIFLLVNLGVIFALENVRFFKRMKEHTINFFVGLENLILIFVASMIYHRFALDYTSANINFGIYTSLIGAALIFYGGFLQLKRNQKEITKEVFASGANSLHNGVNLKPDLNIDKPEENQNNEQVKKENSQLSFGDYE